MAIEATKSKKGPQILAAVIVTIGAFVCGNGLGWSSPALPGIKDAEQISHLVTEEEASWIGSCFTIGCFIAVWLVGFLTPIIGPKWAMLCMGAPAVVGWILLLIGKPLDDHIDPIWLFYTGRILTGMGGGAFGLAGPLYISETTDVDIRGALGSLQQLQVAFGVAFVDMLSINGTVGWVKITGICIAFPVLMSIAMFFVPDSPVYLISKGKNDAARKSLERLRGKHYIGIDEEIEAIKRSEAERNDPNSRISYQQLFSNSMYLKPFAFSLTLMFLQQFSGINQVIFYLQLTFEKSNSDMDAGLSSFIAALMQVFGTGLAIVVIDRVGRKVLLVASGATMGISILGLAVFFYLDEKNKSVDNITWLPLVCLMLYIFGFAIGYGPIPWAMNAELFPKEAQGVMASIAAGFNWACAFIVTKFATNLEDLINTSGLYFLFCAVNVLGIVFVIILLPETKGKTPDDMKEYFSRKKM